MFILFYFIFNFISRIWLSLESSSLNYRMLIVVMHRVSPPARPTPKLLGVPSQRLVLKNFKWNIYIIIMDE